MRFFEKLPPRARPTDRQVDPLLYRTQPYPHSSRRKRLFLLAVRDGHLAGAAV
jgi:hypothetical protein